MLGRVTRRAFSFEGLNLNVAFEGGGTLIIYDDSLEYESYIVGTSNKEVIV